MGPDFEVQLGRPPNDSDSWLHARVGGWSVLNLNDCVFRTPSDLVRIRRRVGSVDLLLTQFSYATWCGNRGDDEGPRAAARLKLQQITDQLQCFRPRYLLPFASYVWFCHERNFHMNAGANRLPRILSAFASASAAPVVLAPGERWGLGTAHDSGPAVARYEAEWGERLQHPELVMASGVDWGALAGAAEAFRQRGRQRNWRWRLERLQPFTAFLEDLGRSAAFSYRVGFQPVDTPRDGCDVALTSDFLKYAFDFDWGFDTLSVSGCFEKPAGGRFEHLEEYQWVARLNNQGRRLEDPARRLMGYLRDRLS